MARESVVRALRAVRQALLALIVLALIGVWLQYHASTARLLVTELHFNDFGKFYYSAQAFLEGRDMYGPSPATSMSVGGGERRQFWNLNPPHFHLLLLPLTTLPPLDALVVWAALSLAALVASVAIIARELAFRWTARRVLLVTLAVVAASPTSATVLTGQMTFLLLLPMTMAWRWARRDHWTAAAVTLGVLASVKPFLGLFLPALLLIGRPRAAGVMAASGAACFAGGFAVFGWQPHATWLRVIADVDWHWAAMNASLAGLLARTLTPSPYFTAFTDAPSLSAAAWLAAAGGVVAWTCLRLRGAAGAAQSANVFALPVLAGLLVAPLGWIYYLPLAAPGLLDLTIWSGGAWRIGLLVLVSAPGLIVPTQGVVAAGSTAVGTVTLGNAYALTLIALWLGATLRLRRP